MKYYQKVILKNISFKLVVSAFQDIALVEYLIKMQPVKLLKWDGIRTNDTAYFKLWFLGWKDFKVKHKLIEMDSTTLYFIDSGIVLPLGIKFWEHKHIIKKVENSVEIVDSLIIKHQFVFLGYILYPILIVPIFLRKLLYQSYFSSLLK